MSFDGAENQESLADQLSLVEAELLQIDSQIERLLEHQSQLQSQKERLQRLVRAEERASRADWSNSTFEWENKVNNLRRSLFHLRSWRPLQREVINATLQCRDVLCVMPSGGGKSICYQLPAMVDPHRLTVVVSPLLSLISDQMNHLKELNIPTSALMSLSPRSTNREDLSLILQSLDSPTCPTLLYCTPERLIASKRLLSKLEKLYKSNRLARFAIDESHCVSQWGNDFRPDYKKLGILRQQFPDVPILALTATATPSVCDDIINTLHMNGCEVFRKSINRPNLYYEVVQKPSGKTSKGADAIIEDMSTWIRFNFENNESGIIYCLTKKDVENVATELQCFDVSCGTYHADMDLLDRETVHKSWMEGDLQVIVATIAFGMGISKSDVRFVIHHSMSKSIGRAIG